MLEAAKEMKAQRASTLTMTPSSGNVSLLVLLAYTGFAVIFGAMYDGADGTKPRVLEWDAARLVAQVFIVAGHIEAGLRQQDWYSARAYLGTVAASLEGRFSVYGAGHLFSMPMFCFLSGVWGQKFDSEPGRSVRRELEIRRPFCPRTEGETA